MLTYLYIQSLAPQLEILKTVPPKKTEQKKFVFETFSTILFDKVTFKNRYRIFPK